MIRRAQTKLRNCPVCHRVYVEYGAGMCGNCYEKMNQLETDMAKYMRDHPDAEASELMEQTGASPALVRHMAHLGRLEDINAKVSYPCSRCGKPIQYGKVCNDCLASVKQDVRKAHRRFAKKHPRLAAVQASQKKKSTFRPAPRPAQESQPATPKPQPPKEEEQQPAPKKDVSLKKKIRRMFFLEGLERDEKRS